MALYYGRTREDIDVPNHHQSMIEAVPAGYQIQFPKKKEVPTDRASLSENAESPADAQVRASVSENAEGPSDAPAGAHDASTDASPPPS